MRNFHRYIADMHDHSELRVCDRQVFRTYFVGNMPGLLHGRDYHIEMRISSVVVQVYKTIKQQYLLKPLKIRYRVEITSTRSDITMNCHLAEEVISRVCNAIMGIIEL